MRRRCRNRTPGGARRARRLHPPGTGGAGGRPRARLERYIACACARRRLHRARLRPRLDDTRALRDDARKVVAALQARYATETGISLQGEAQQCAGLSPRGADKASRHFAAAAALRAISSTARPCRAPRASRRRNWPISTAASPMPGMRRWRANWRSSTDFSGRILSLETEVRASRRRTRFGALDVHAGLAEWAEEQKACRPDHRRQPRVRRRRRPPSRGRGGGHCCGRALLAERLHARCGGAGGQAPPIHHRPEHGR